MVRTYDQYCGLAHALDLVGSRWTLLVVRELLVGPKRFTEIEEGLPGIPSNVLSSRLKQLEDSNLVERRVLPRPFSGVAYALTKYGQDLEPVVAQLGMWGAKSMGPPTPGHPISCSSLAIALRSMFHSDKAPGSAFSFELDIDDHALRGRVMADEVVVPDETVESPDVTLAGDPAAFTSIFRKMETLDGALESGALRLQGSRKTADRFFEIFQLPSQ